MSLGFFGPREYHVHRARFTPRSLLRLVLPAMVLAGMPPSQPASASALYHIDQRYGSIQFSVSTLGMFDVEGRFPKFEGQLLLDVDHPERTRIEVAIDARSVEMPLPDQAALLRSADYFDTARYPVERFATTSISALSPSHYTVHGRLEIRGISRDAVLDAVLRDRHVDHGVETADFIVTGEIKRSAFGMNADRAMLSNAVRLTISIRLMVGKHHDAG